MVRFSCKFCGYSIEKPQKHKECPYCGKANALEEEENAEEILLDV